VVWIAEALDRSLLTVPDFDVDKAQMTHGWGHEHDLDTDDFERCWNRLDCRMGSASPRALGAEARRGVVMASPVTVGTRYVSGIGHEPELA
jgi:hypothetical protein